MHRLYPLIFAAVGSLIISGLVIAQLRFLHPDWWKRKPVKYPALFSAALILISLTAWVTGIYGQMKTIANIGALLASSIFLLQLSLIIALSISGLIHSVVRISYWLESKKDSDGGFNGSRRNFIKKASVIIPGAALASQAAGIAGSYFGIRIPVIKLPIAGLPDDLQGMKIAHLSDSHLGHYKTLEDLEESVEKIISHSPDLTLVTGDIADNLAILEDANRIISAINPPLGTFASIGNHEYYRGIAAVKRIFEKSPFPLLIEEGITIDRNGRKIFIGGADDPVSLRRVNVEFLKSTVEKTIRPARGDSFRILMSHRPRALDYAPEHNISLILAGHTHGGQMGIFGHSAFESFWPELYLWGIYRKGGTTLYTSSGMGHWMPVRLGCPAEAPILILEKSAETPGI